MCRHVSLKWVTGLSLHWWNREESHWMSHLISDAHFTWYISAKSLSLPTPRSTGYQSTAARWQKLVFTLSSDNGSHLGSIQHGSKHSRSNYGDKDISLADVFSWKKKKKVFVWLGLIVGFGRPYGDILTSFSLVHISFSIGNDWQKLKYLQNTIQLHVDKNVNLEYQEIYPHIY